jgi:DNA-binding transcriptional regulator YiaG
LAFDKLYVALTAELITLGVKRKMERKFINWKKTGKVLELLRGGNVNLRNQTCKVVNDAKSRCNGDCESCKYKLENNISRSELAKVFHVSESVIFNWENGKTPVSVDDILYYCQLAKVKLCDILVYD